MTAQMAENILTNLNMEHGGMEEAIRKKPESKEKYEKLYMIAKKVSEEEKRIKKKQIKRKERKRKKAAEKIENAYDKEDENICEASENREIVSNDEDFNASEEEIDDKNAEVLESVTQSPQDYCMSFKLNNEDAKTAEMKVETDEETTNKTTEEKGEIVNEVSNEILNTIEKELETEEDIKEKEDKDAVAEEEKTPNKDVINVIDALDATREIEDVSGMSESGPDAYENENASRSEDVRNETDDALDATKETEDALEKAKDAEAEEEKTPNKDVNNIIDALDATRETKDVSGMSESGHDVDNENNNENEVMSSDEKEIEAISETEDKNEVIKKENEAIDNENENEVMSSDEKEDENEVIKNKNVVMSSDEKGIEAIGEKEDENEVIKNENEVIKNENGAIDNENDNENEVNKTTTTTSEMALTWDPGGTWNAPHSGVHHICTTLTAPYLHHIWTPKMHHTGARDLATPFTAS